MKLLSSLMAYQLTMINIYGEEFVFTRTKKSEESHEEGLPKFFANKTEPNALNNY